MKFGTSHQEGMKFIRVLGLVKTASVARLSAMWECVEARLGSFVLVVL